MTEYRKYRVYCVTEAANVETDYRDTVPTTCPNNNSHTIDSDQTVIIDTISQNEITIREEPVPTKGYYRCDGWEFAIPSSTGAISTTGLTGINYTASPNSTMFEIHYPYNITVMSFSLDFSQDNVGDRLCAYSFPTIPLGAIAANANTGDTVISLSSTIMPYLLNSFSLYLEDTTTGMIQITPEINTVDTINNQVTLYSGISHALNASNTIMARPAVPRVKFMRCMYPETRNVGDKKIGGSAAPNTVKAVILYENNSGSAKRLNLHCDLLF